MGYFGSIGLVIHRDAQGRGLLQSPQIQLRRWVMALGGMEMLLKSMGVDPGKIMADFQALKDGVLALLKKLDERISETQKMQAEIQASQAEVKIMLTELTLWMRVQKEQARLDRLNQLQQPPTAQQPLQQPPTMLQENQL